MRKFIVSLTTGTAMIFAAAFGLTAPAHAAGGIHAPEEQWSWTGFFGSFDKAAAQRGFQVYQEICSACHSLDLVAYRNLAALGYNEDEIKTIAAEYIVIDGPDEEGEMFERPAKPSDHFVAPFENVNAARAANGGAYPADLSLIVKSRATGSGNIAYNFVQWMSARGTASGADYVYALLTGYDDTQPVAEGQYWNKYFPGNAISMAPPLADDMVEYADGTAATLDQMTHDVSTFLAWASEPELEQRKSMGLKAILFLLVLLGLAIAAKRRRWADIKK